MSLALFLYVAAAILFALGMLNVPSGPRFSFVAAGLFCWLMADKVSDGTFDFGD